MSGSVTLPTWLFLLILLFAAVTAGSHLLIPPVRWFFRRRMQRVVDELNKRLERPIQPFKLARRHDMIQRLIYDPKVAEAVAQHAAEAGLREDVAFSEARRYAREIVPSFSASAYFGIAIRAARWLSTRLYDVRINGNRSDALTDVDPGATIVFVMNHRSNLDYVLVTYLAADRSALSYAVGEWARIWPLSRLIRAMGAYFIRRKSRNTLYRRVLARYVQLATQAGVTQAIFPEGGLSLDGAVGEARLGLLSYLAAEFDPKGRDIVFVPVALNYDRVIEDRILTEAAAQGERRFRGSFVSGTVFVLRWFVRRLSGRVKRFGLAAVSFGEPLSLKAFAGAEGVRVTALAQELMHRIRKEVPLLPVPLAAAAIRSGLRRRDEIAAEMLRLADTSGRDVHWSGESAQTSMEAAIGTLQMRGLVTVDGQQVLPAQEDLLAYYAASAMHYPKD